MSRAAAALRTVTPGVARTIDVHVDDLMAGEAVLTRSEVAAHLGIDRARVARTLPGIGWHRVAGQRETVTAAAALHDHLPAGALDAVVSPVGYLRLDRARSITGLAENAFNRRIMDGTMRTVLVRDASHGTISRMLPPQSLGSLEQANAGAEAVTRARRGMPMPATLSIAAGAAAAVAIGSLVPRTHAAPASAAPSPSSTPTTEPHPTTHAAPQVPSADETRGAQVAKVATGEVGQRERVGNQLNPRVRAYFRATPSVSTPIERSADPASKYLALRWPGYFATWARATAGAPIGPHGQGGMLVDDLIHWARTSHQWSGPKVMPKAGDVLALNLRGTTGRAADDAAVVIDVSDSKIHTVQGNVGGAVRRVDYRVDDPRIVGSIGTVPKGAAS